MTEDRIDVLLAECLEHVEDAWQKELEERCSAHPELASELRRRFESMMAFGLIDPPLRDTPQRLGKYKLVRELGRGSMGVAYLAVDTELGRQVTLKVIRPEQLPFRSARERFRREMVATSRIEHRSICPIYEAGEHEGTPFLAMRYIAGQSLACWLAANREGSEPPGGPSSDQKRARVDMLCGWFIDLADGLHAAHEAGIIHRDVKPANILIRGEGAPVLVDFGLAWVVETGTERGMTATGIIVGTPAYMAPEQIQSEGKVDARTDVYSLGLTLRECLTLQPAFAAHGREALYRQVLEADLPPPRDVDASIPEDLSLVVATATAKDPAERYATAKEFADDLRRVRRFEPIRARRPSLPLRMRRWIQRHPVVASTMAVSILALLVVLFLLLRALRSERQATALSTIYAASAIQRERPWAALEPAAKALSLSHDPVVLGLAQEILHQLRYVTPLTPHGGRRLDFARWSPDFAFVVTGGQDVDTSIFKPDGRLVKQLTGTASAEQKPCVAFRRDEVVVAARDGSLQIHALETGAQRQRLNGPSGTRQAWHVCATDRAILAVHPQTAEPRGTTITRLWIDSGAGFRALQLAPLKPSKWKVAAFLPDGRILAAGCVWNSTGERLQSLPTITDTAVSWISAGGKKVAVASRDRGIHLFEIGKQLELIRKHEFGQQLLRPVVSSDGEHTAIPFVNGRVQILDAHGEQAAAWHTRHSHRVSAVAFSPDGRRVVTGNWTGAVQVFNMAGNEIFSLLGHVAGVTWLEFGQDNSRLLTAGWDGTARIWDLERFPSRQLGEFTGSLAASPDGRHVVVPERGGGIRLCDARAKIVDRCATPPRVMSVSFASPDVILIGERSSIREWHPATHEVKLTRSPERLAKTPPQRLANGGVLIRLQSRRLMISDQRGGWIPFVKKNNIFTIAVASHDGRLIAAQRWDNRVNVFDLNGKGRHVFKTDGLIHGMVFSANNHLLAAGCGDTLAYLWDLRTGQERTFPGHRNEIRDVALSADAAKLATVATDGMLRVFDTGSGRMIIQIRAHEEGSSNVVFLRNDRIVTTGRDGFVRWWMLNPEDVRAEIERLRR